ncbi:hypothetical protein M0R45_019859 [Rubus argutus]|uniref:Uncharacterized protein n=1 Tax=Rubus argutus TaxID=59490 RepID=A0AAW1X7K0_RUBAR
MGGGDIPRSSLNDELRSDDSLPKPSHPPFTADVAQVWSIMDGGISGMHNDKKANGSGYFLKTSDAAMVATTLSSRPIYRQLYVLRSLQTKFLQLHANCTMHRIVCNIIESIQRIISATLKYALNTMAVLVLLGAVNPRSCVPLPFV